MHGLSQASTYGALACFCIGLLLSGCDLSKAPLGKAERFYEKGEVDAALIEIRNALQKNPSDGEAHLLLAHILADQGDGAAAEKEIQKARQLGVDRIRVDAALAKALLATGQFQRLLDEVQPAEGQKGEAWADVLAARVTAQLALRQVEPARADLNRLSKTMPKSVGALLGAARFAFLSMDSGRALALVEQALAKAPRRLEVWMLKADLLHRQGKLDDALVAYEQAAQAIPGSAIPRLAAARVLIDTGRFDAAQKQIDQVLRFSPNLSFANHIQALLYFNQKDYAKAQEFAQRTLKLAPDYLPADYLLGQIEIAQGALQQAEERFRRIVATFPQDLPARKLYATTLVRMKESERALEVLTPALKQAPEDPELLSLAGEAYTLAGKFAEANGYMERAAAAQEKKRAEALLSLGLRYVAGGEAERGIAELQEASGLDEVGVRADFTLALIHLRRKEFDEALQAAQNLEKKRPTNPLPFNLAGAAYLGKGDKAAARASFERALALDAGFLPAAENLARLDLEQGQPEAAKQRIEAVLAKDKDNVDALVALRRVNEESAQLVSSLEQARKADPKALAPRLALAKKYLAGGDTRNALEVAREAQNLAPDDPQTLDALGAAQLATGQKSEAVATYGKLVSTAPYSALAHYRLATAQARAGNLKQAEAQYRRAIALKPDDMAAMVGLAEVYMRGGSMRKAMNLAAEMKQRMPRSPAGHILEGDVLARQKKYAEAARAYDAAYALAPSGLMAVKHHEALRKSGQKSDGARLQQWFKDHPRDALTRQYLANQQLEAGEAAAAIENFQIIVKANPTNAAALNNLANVYFAQKDPRALETAEAAYKLRPDNAAIADTLGWLLTQTGQTARGLQVLQQALEINPDIVEHRLHFAVALAKSGDKERARAELKKLRGEGKEIKLDESARALIDSQ